MKGSYLHRAVMYKTCAKQRSVLSRHCRNTDIMYSRKQTASNTWPHSVIKLVCRFELCCILCLYNCWDQNHQCFHHVSSYLFRNSSIKSNGQTGLEFQ